MVGDKLISQNFRIDKQLTLGIIKNWPNQRAAEHETIERFKISAEIAGFELMEVDHNGKAVNGFEPDFVLTLHFDTPKLCPQPTIHTLWNPSSFLKDRGFSTSKVNTLSNTFFASGGSPKNDERLFEEFRTTIGSFLPPIYPSLDRPILSPLREGPRRLFYAGINWERLRGEGRFSRLFEALDFATFLDIYGPTEMFGTRIWDGFSSYRGELPFDGVSLIKKANESGAYLCLSSPAHVSSGLLSNRIFEACAAGTTIIANYHEEAFRIFGESIFWIESTDETSMAKEITSFMETMNRDRDLAYEKAAKSQQLFLENFRLSHLLDRSLSIASLQYQKFMALYTQKTFLSNQSVGSDEMWRIRNSTHIKQIPYAIGKAIAEVEKFPNTNVITGSWLSENEKGEVEFNPYWRNFCPFCGTDIGYANILTNKVSDASLTLKDRSGLQVLLSFEPIVRHQCNSFGFFSIPSRIGIENFKKSLHSKIRNVSLDKPPGSFVSTLGLFESHVFKAGKFVFTKTPLKILYKPALSLWIKIKS